MADKPRSAALTPEDERILAWLRKTLTKEHGKVSFTFIVRQGLRALEKQLKSGEA